MNDVPITYRLAFRNTHLQSVMDGTKTCTIRVSKRAQHVKQGSELYLLFGRRDRPTLLVARAVRVEHVDLTDVLAWWSGEADDLLSVPLNVASITAELPPVATLDEVPEALREALRDSGGHLDDVIDEMLERQQQVVTCIWWQSPA